LTWLLRAASDGSLIGYDSPDRHRFALFTLGRVQMQQRPA